MKLYDVVIEVAGYNVQRVCAFVLSGYVRYFYQQECYHHNRA